MSKGISSTKTIFFTFITAVIFLLAFTVPLPTFGAVQAIDETIEYSSPGTLTFDSSESWTNNKQISNIDIVDGSLTLQNTDSNGVWISPTIKGSEYINPSSLISSVDYRGNQNNFTTVVRQSSNADMENSTVVRTFYNVDGSQSYENFTSVRQKYLDVKINISSSSNTNSEYQYLSLNYDNFREADVGNLVLMVFFGGMLIFFGVILILLVKLLE